MKRTGGANEWTKKISKSISSKSIAKITCLSNSGLEQLQVGSLDDLPSKLRRVVICHEPKITTTQPFKKRPTNMDVECFNQFVEYCNNHQGYYFKPSSYVIYFIEFATPALFLLDDDEEIRSLGEFLTGKTTKDNIAALCRSKLHIDDWRLQCSDDAKTDFKRFKRFIQLAHVIKSELSQAKVSKYPYIRTFARLIEDMELELENKVTLLKKQKTI